MRSLLCVNLILYLVSGICGIENNIISLDDGLIKGWVGQSYKGREYLSFEGIPYAKQPIHELRFEDPQPPDPWPGILVATQRRACLDVMLTDSGHAPVGSEDCLYLNVYVPRVNATPETNLDVIVHIHASAFEMGNAIMLHSPSKMMDIDVVYVTINYRLGPLGFYSPGDGTGNYGLKDQTMALKWIQNNIDKFGGNKNSVTLLGLSSGGSYAHLHYFSPLSRGLFHKGFAQSGLALNPWAVRESYAKNSKKLAELMGCSAETIEESRDCLRNKSAIAIVDALREFYTAPFIPMAVFGPVIETNSSSAFLTKLPYWSLKSNEVADLPFLMSMTVDDGTVPAAVLYNEIEEVDKNWKKWAPLLLDYYLYNQTKQDEISEKTRQFYYKDATITEENYPGVVSACSHRNYHVGAIKTAMLQPHATLNSNTYFLMMAYAASVHKRDFTSHFMANLGVGHYSDAKFYYDGDVFIPSNLDQEEEEMKDVLLAMLASFAKTGKPTVPSIDFEPMPKNGDLKYLLVLGPNNTQMRTEVGGENQQYYDFWELLDDIEVPMMS